MSDGFYERIDDHTFAATRATQSPWGENLQHGSPPTTLLAHVMLRDNPRDDMRLARITTDFLGAIPLGRMTVRTRVVRAGKRIELLEGTLEADGREAVFARVWRIATQADGSVPAATTPPDAVPPLPGEQVPARWLTGWGYGESFEWRYSNGSPDPGPAAIWSRARVPLIAGEPIEPLHRALLIADSANGISGELPMDAWLFVPPSLTVALERYPRGEWALLEARTTLESDGLGMTTGRLADADGYLGATLQPLFVERRR